MEHVEWQTLWRDVNWAALREPDSGEAVGCVEVITWELLEDFFLCPFIFAEPAVLVGHGKSCGSVLPV